VSLSSSDYDDESSIDGNSIGPVPIDIHTIDPESNHPNQDWSTSLSALFTENGTDDKWRIEIDGGAHINSCPHKHLLHNYRTIRDRGSAHDASGGAHRAIGVGYLCIPFQHGYQMVHCKHIPTIKAFVFSPSLFARSRRFIASVENRRFNGSQSFVYFEHGVNRGRDLYLPCNVHIDGQLYTEPIRVPTT
jgi:hypothetical protein